ncbi:MAG: NAD(P)H-binding protein [Verrucomicrobia bacterium]|nr:NAD(P)H-binding protein [Verrucomicrobiota bacterium]
MNIGIIGATGNIGRHILAEAIRRGHHVTAFTRDKTHLGKPDSSDRVVWKEVNILDAASLEPAITGLDVLVSAYQPGNASRDFNDTVQRSIGDPTTFVTAAKALLKALERYPAMRLIVLGGAGSLEVKPGLQRVDWDDDLRASLKELGLPEGYALAVRGHRDALNTYRLSDRLWTYLSPAEQIYPGERTGRFRIGGNQPVVDADGQSRISYEDCAVAIIDEAELPQHVQRRFTIGY